MITLMWKGDYAVVARERDKMVGVLIEDNTPEQLTDVLNKYGFTATLEQVRDLYRRAGYRVYNNTVYR